MGSVGNTMAFCCLAFSTMTSNSARPDSRQAVSTNAAAHVPGSIPSMAAGLVL